MLTLIAGLILFLGVHVLPAFEAQRAGLVQRWGERRYKGSFTLISFAGLALIIAGYASALPGPRLFAPSQTAVAIAPYAMPISLVLFAAANMRTHIRRVVKHPMLLGLAIWAGVHLLANGDTRGTLLFASFLVYAAIDFVSVVHRHAVKEFVPTARHDAIAVAAGIVTALALMALHRPLFGVAVVGWGVGGS
jgi:uncharacterized membrane protein